MKMASLPGNEVRLAVQAGDPEAVDDVGRVERIFTVRPVGMWISLAVVDNLARDPGAL